MRHLWSGLAALVIPLLGTGVQAAPATFTFNGILESTATASKPTEFTAVFSYDTASFVRDGTDSTLFNGIGATQSATLKFADVTYTFDSAGYFFQRVSDTLTPLYEFGIRGTQGYLGLKYSGDIAEGLYQLPSGASDNLTPTEAIFTGTTLAAPVSPVPLPRSLPLFAGAILMTGFLGWRRQRMPQEQATRPHSASV